METFAQKRSLVGVMTPCYLAVMTPDAHHIQIALIWALAQGGEPWEGAPSPEAIAERIAPTVRRVVAAELRRVGEGAMRRDSAAYVPVSWLHARADELEAS